MIKRVAAIIVTFNRLELLKECINYILLQTYPCDIYIIDNNSTDGTGAYIKDFYKNNAKIIYYNTKQNLGGAGGFNIGIRLAIEDGYEFLWIMDDDCFPLNDALEVFMQYNEHNALNYGFLSSKVFWKDNTISKMNIQRRNVYFNVKDFDSEVVKISMASFVSLFIPVWVVRIVGLPIKDFFIWTDDWEYTRRISRRYPSFLLNKSRVIHFSQNNIGANIVSSPIEKLNRFSYLYRNDVYLYKREGFFGCIYELCRLVIHILKIVLFSKDNKLKRIYIIIFNTIKGLFFYPSIEKI